METKTLKNNNQTPYFSMHKAKLEGNLAKLRTIEKRSGVKILHTLKSFNEPTVMPLIASELSGMSLASAKELQMAQEAKAQYLHLYAPAFKASELEKMATQIDTLSLNSLTQWSSFKHLDCSKGVRINPKLHLPIPDHCNPNVAYSRLGVDAFEFLEHYKEQSEEFKALEGLHFHALFQSSVEGVVLLLDFITQHFNELLPQLKWLNLGGGHNFTEVNYNIDYFCKTIDNFKNPYPNIELIFEPGESVTKGCGEFVTTVLDIVNVGEHKVAILETSVETHLLDVAIVNLRLKVKGTQADSTPYFYELAGNSCMQGDYIGEYFFKEDLEIGSQVIFEDMMGYTMVKMTEFNGMEKANFYLK